MSGYMKVFTGMTVNDGCPMRFYANCEGGVTFVLGQGRDDFELTMERQSITRFIAVATEALAVEPKPD